MIHITMPRLSDTMEEGVITRWYKSAGDEVQVGDLLFEVETDKASMDHEAYESGTLATVLVPEGTSAAIGAPVAELDDGSPDAPPSTEPVSERPAVPPHQEPPTASSRTTARGPRLRATPLVRRIARERGISLERVTGTGPGGRIIRRDLDNLEAAPESHIAERMVARDGAPAVGSDSTSPATTSVHARTDLRDTEYAPMSGTRKAIARRLSQSAQTIPHFHVTRIADVDELLDLRSDLNARLARHHDPEPPPRISVNDLVVKAVAIALARHPTVNASYPADGSEDLEIHHRVNVGVAVAAEDGLVVPVVMDADRKSVSQVSAEAGRLAERAHAKRLTPAEMSGGTFTVSNLGMLGVEHFTAIINPPEAAILSVGETTREPVVHGDSVVPRQRMRLTLGADHRVIDGALAAQFLGTLAGLLEEPWLIVV